MEEKIAIISIGFWVAGIFIGFGFGVKLGKYLERCDWNKLIEQGKIKKPQ
jgi:hypothetical protein